MVVGEKAGWIHARLTRSFVMEPVRGIVPPWRPVAATRLMFGGVRAKSNGNCSIDHDRKERVVICCLELWNLNLTSFVC